MRITPLPEVRKRSAVAHRATTPTLSFTAQTGQSYNLDTE